MSKTITISDELENLIVDFCKDELNYHINESGCADEYDGEIKGQIELLKLLGYADFAEQFQEDYQSYLDENGFGVNEDGTPWYDWWNDVDYYLLYQDSDFKELLYHFRDENGLPTDDRDPLSDRMGHIVAEYVRDNAEGLGIIPDDTIPEFAFSRIVPILMNPEDEFWSSYEEGTVS